MKPTKEEIIEALEEAFTFSSFELTSAEHPFNPEILFEKQAEAILSLFPANDEGWVDVEERLPENTLPILLWDKEEKKVVEGFYYPSAHMFYGVNSSKLFNITHWQPLPKAPTNKSKQ